VQPLLTLPHWRPTAPRAARWAHFLGWLGGSGTVLLTGWWLGTVIVTTWLDSMFIGALPLIAVFSPISTVVCAGLLGCLGAHLVEQEMEATGCRLLFLAGLYNGGLALVLGVGPQVVVQDQFEFGLIAGAGSLLMLLASRLAWQASAV